MTADKTLLELEELAERIVGLDELPPCRKIHEMILDLISEMKVVVQALAIPNIPSKHLSRSDIEFNIIEYIGFIEEIESRIKHPKIFKVA
jgi:hypothetical protein